MSHPSKLVELPTPKYIAHEELVKLLEEMLVEAKEGKIIGMAATAISADNQSWTYVGRTDKVNQLIGGLHRAIHDIISGSF